jgi:uncharacterized Rmd1/YagE family protein
MFASIVSKRAVRLPLRMPMRIAGRSDTYNVAFNTFSTSITPASIAFKRSKESVPDPPGGVSVNINAYYIARSIDILQIQGKNYMTARQEFQPKSVLIVLNESENQYIAAFKYGSVVFFNIPPSQHMEHLRQLKEACLIPIEESLQHNESFKVVVHKTLESPSVIKSEHLNIRELDRNNLTIVSTVMAQTVALDFHAVAVDRMIETFEKLNMKVQETGSFNSLSSTQLHKLVASNNAVITSVLSKLGIFEGTEAAWENSDYYSTWEGLRKDFEIDYRYKDLDLKLRIVKDDCRFFLEVLHNQKSSKLEWIIIILISGEMCIGLCELALHLHQIYH